MTIALVPLALLAIACTLKFSIVLSLLGRAVGGRALPATVVAGVAILLAAFVLAPVVGDGDMATLSKPDSVRAFLEKHVPVGDRPSLVEQQRVGRPDANEHDLSVLLPAYAIGELKAAFRVGFFLLLPFLVLDLLIAVVLLGLGVYTLEARVVSLPLKLLLFVSIDGWNLVVHGLLGAT